MALRRLFEIHLAYESGHPPQLVVHSGPEILVEGLPPGSSIVLRRAGEAASQRKVDRLELGAGGETVLYLAGPSAGLPVTSGWEVWTSLESAVARSIDLRSEVARALSIDLEGIEGVRVAWGWWMLAQILPSFGGDAVLGLAYDGRSGRGLLRVRSGDVFGPVSVGVEGLDLLRRIAPVGIALEEPPTHFACDGIGYRVEVVTAALDARLAFSNPWRPDLEALERSLLQAAELVAGPDCEYLGVWRRHLDRAR